ncbi:MAG: hypothetical protein WKG06_47930 [Segetibacter sp.]
MSYTICLLTANDFVFSSLIIPFYRLFTNTPTEITVSLRPISITETSSLLRIHPTLLITSYALWYG